MFVNTLTSTGYVRALMIDTDRRFGLGNQWKINSKSLPNRLEHPYIVHTRTHCIENPFLRFLTRGNEQKLHFSILFIINEWNNKNSPLFIAVSVTVAPTLRLLIIHQRSRRLLYFPIGHL